MDVIFPAPIITLAGLLYIEIGMYIVLIVWMPPEKWSGGEALLYGSLLFITWPVYPIISAWRKYRTWRKSAQNDQNGGGG